MYIILTSKFMIQFSIYNRNTNNTKRFWTNLFYILYPPPSCLCLTMSGHITSLAFI